MNHTGRLLLVAALTSALSTPAILAQSSQTAQNPQSQPNQDQYSGVSHPPPDNTIQADESTQPPPPPPAAAPTPKPSAAVPASPAPAPAAAAAPAARTPEDSDDGIVTSVPAASATDSQFDNTDDGIVTSVPQAPSGSKLEKRYDPNNDIVNVVPSNPNELGSGTNIQVRLSQSLSTTQTEAGTAFRATVVHDVYKEGRVIIPAGSEMRGRVVFVSQGHHLGPHATIRLRPDYVILPDGTAYHLYAEVVSSGAPGTRTDDEGGIQAANHYRKDAIEYGGGVGAAAVAGAAVAGPVGAGVGSLVGAGLVTAHLLIQQPQAARLPTGTDLVFSLTEPMGLTPAKN